MPSGVEHAGVFFIENMDAQVRFPVMPSGVEHLIAEALGLEVIGEISRDAVRR